MRLFLTLFFSSILICFSSPAFAAERTIATVDVNKILNELDEAKDLKRRLDAQSEKAKKEIESERATLKNLEEKIKSQKLENDSEEVERFRTKAREYERLVKDSEEEIRREFLKVNKSLTEKVLNAVKKYAQSNEIDLVLDKSSASRTPVLFGEEGADITAQVLSSLND